MIMYLTAKCNSAGQKHEYNNINIPTVHVCTTKLGTIEILLYQPNKLRNILCTKLLLNNPARMTFKEIIKCNNLEF